MTIEKSIIPAFYAPMFLSPAEAGLFFQMLEGDLEWERRETAPRFEYWQNDLGNSYTYGRGKGVRTYDPKPTHIIIETIKTQLEEMFGFRYEGCFLNMYADGTDALGWHADDDPGIDHTYGIAVVSLGQKRAIQMRPNDDPKTHHSIELGSGSLFMMNAGAQQTWQHRIPKVGALVRPRISLTFRKLLP